MSGTFLAYTVVTLLAVAANSFSATVDFIRFERVVANMDRTGVPRSWLYPLGAAKAAGAAGLLAGFAVPFLGTAAAACLSVFFVGALGAHVRARNWDVVPPTVFLLLAVGAMALSLAR